VGSPARDVAFIRQAFAQPRAEPAQRSAPQGVSAVLLALYESAGEPELLYTQRAASLRSHPGEISFPGGRVEPDDASPMHAALREAEEEVGIPPGDVQVLGWLTDFLTHRDVLVCAYVGEIVGPEAVDPATQTLTRPGRRPPTAPRSEAEVAHVFTVPIADLLDPARYEGRAIEGMGRRGRVHYWRVGGRVMWGITGELTARFLERVYGWAPPAPARVITDLADFRP
jgi:8-oxo-dGTP pyrophosphatase MutT (NUDIX family)